MALSLEKIKELKERIIFEAESSKLTCRKAFIIAAEVGVPLSAIGKTCNEIDIKIVGCQLGCF